MNPQAPERETQTNTIEEQGLGETDSNEKRGRCRERPKKSILEKQIPYLLQFEAFLREEKREEMNVQRDHQLVLYLHQCVHPQPTYAIPSSCVDATFPSPKGLLPTEIYFSEIGQMLEKISIFW